MSDMLSKQSAGTQTDTTQVINQPVIHILERITDGFIALDSQWRLIYINTHALPLFQMKYEDMLGKNIWELFPHQIGGVAYQNYHRARESGQAVHFEAWFGPDLCTEQHAYPSSDGLSVYMRDITQRKRSEETLHVNEGRLRLLMEGIPAAVAMFDCEMRYLYVSRRWQENYRCPGRNLIGLTHAEAFPELPASKHEAYQRALRGERIRNEEDTLAHADGSTDWIRWEAIPWHDARGEVGGIIVFNEIITERKELEKRKDEFLSLASHELKTPVTTLKGFAQLLLRRLRKQGDTQSLDSLDKMVAQLDKQTLLINDLLDISRIQAGKLVFREQYFNLAELVKETVENLDATYPSHRLIISASEPASVYADRDRIGQVLINLLTNAVKYSPLADRVLISLACADGQATVCVQDFGLGISSDQQQQVFERFYQVASGSKNRNLTGLGIGLYISREIIQRHQGNIWVDSTFGQGSTFRFTLPLASPAPSKA